MYATVCLHRSLPANPQRWEAESGFVFKLRQGFAEEIHGLQRETSTPMDVLAAIQCPIRHN